MVVLKRVSQVYYWVLQIETTNAYATLHQYFDMCAAENILPAFNQNRAVVAFWIIHERATQTAGCTDPQVQHMNKSL